jgi:hypothetical protein
MEVTIMMQTIAKREPKKKWYRWATERKARARAPQKPHQMRECHRL